MSKDHQILLAEDDEDFAVLLGLAFECAGKAEAVEVVHDGQRAISYLNGEGAYADRSAYPLPSLVLLDMRLPRVGGFDVLRWIRGRSDLGRLGVVILTGGENEADARLAEELGADSYVVKPFGFQDLVAIARNLSNSWLEEKPPHLGGARFPPGPERPAS